MPEEYKGPWFSVEVLFSQEGPEIKRFIKKNLTQKDLKHFRENVFIDGIFIPIDPGHWVLVSPWNIKSIDIFRQSKFINNV